jgi:AcrR family transcriptional regulator
VLDAALVHFAERGYDRATLDDIAASATASKGAVYWYFDNKRDLFVATVERELGRLGEHLEGLASGHEPSPLDRLQRIVAGTLDYYARRPAFSAIMKVTALPAEPEVAAAMERLVRRVYGRARELLRPVVEDGIERGEIDGAMAEVAVPMAIALVDGLVLQASLDPQSIDLRRGAPAFASAFANGLRRR